MKCATTLPPTPHTHHSEALRNIYRHDCKCTKWTIKHCCSSSFNVRLVVQVYPATSSSSSASLCRPCGSRSRPLRRIGSATELRRNEADGGKRNRTRVVRVGALPLSASVVVVARLPRQSAVGSSRPGSLSGRLFSKLA